jgi:hypothetical protein
MLDKFPNDFFDNISSSDMDIYNLLFDIKEIKDSNRLSLFYIEEQLKNLDNRHFLFNKLSLAKTIYMENIDNYDMIMDRLIDIVDNI